jgi:hypothetical protein
MEHEAQALVALVISAAVCLGAWIVGTPAIGGLITPTIAL